ncbi:MAG: cytochrome c oxidase subunit II transmembrane domain-containing protein, partial [Bacillota bacterium]
MNGGFYLLPPSASDAAARYDILMLAEFLLTGFVALAVAFLIVYFSVRYRRDSGADRSAAPVRGRRLEIAWTVIPLLLFLCAFAWAAYDYAQLYRERPDATPVFVVAKQWMWKLEHTNGRREIDELHLPLGQPV